MSIVTIPDHAAQALLNLLSRVQGKDTIESVLTVMVDPCQDVEDTLYELVTERQLDTVEGVNLDQYGVLVGAARRGLSDDDFRRYVRVRIQANRSNGQADVILDVVSEIVGGSAVKYYLFPPAEYQLQYEAATALTSPLITLLGEIMEQITGAGIGYSVVEGVTGAKRFDTPDLGFDEGLFGKAIVVSP